ncbi:efflux transporter outer membrane subunit [Novosphingobium resinovorum]|uniref:RND transporter n=1 Tax=Novosphingobium resinovorum TaxID=158500 RepID=A0A1D8A0H8_9SPHN|nr:MULTISPECIES: efflux transporter outer membrane subunit [Sphingomonadaceae]AOR75560.1 RND transporter [Novosphingobium resinovorum]WJM29590.1 efflux transporter outer membrane subunit [Novosphingobium resinovorum]
MPRFLCSAALALALSACATAGPDYHPPENAVSNAPAAQGTFNSANGAAFSQEPLPDHWWKLYDDPRLDALVEQALAANTDLRAADANLDRARAVLREAAAARTLSTAVSGGVDLSRQSSTGVSMPGVVTDNLGLALSYPLDLKGKLRRAIEASTADAEATEAARDAVRVSVAAATTSAYAKVCAANYQLGVTQRVVQLQRQTLDATRRLQKGGRGTAFDVSRAAAAVETSAAALPAFTAARQNSLYLLATLLGRPPADFPAEVADCATLPRLAGGVPVEDGAALIRRRADIRAAERTIAADTARIGVATADLYPSVSIGGSLGFSGPIHDFGTGDSFGMSLGPLLSWSFPNRPAVRAKIDQADAQVRVDLANFDGTVLEALRQAESAMETYARDREREAALGRAADAAGLSASQAGKLFRFGRSAFLDLLSAQASLASAQVSHASAQTTLVDDQIAVFLALGGGWRQ